METVTEDEKRHLNLMNDNFEMGDIIEASLFELISLGVRPGLIVALAIPLTLAMVFSVMQLTGIDMQRISLGALIIALALLVDDAMTTVDATLTRLAQGDSKVEALPSRFALTLSPCLPARW
jgi:multidrug efflux pump subunit AcrB